MFGIMKIRNLQILGKKPTKKQKNSIPNLSSCL